MKLLSGRSGIVGIGVAAFALMTALPAAATDFVQDQAGMFSAATIAGLNERIANFNAATGKAIVVVTTPSLAGASLQSAAASAFSQQAVNGVLIFIARDDRRDIIVPDRAGARAGWFTPDVLREIRASMEEQFRAENYDAGITGAVNTLLGMYRAHSNAGNQPEAGLAGAPARERMTAPRGVHVPMFWWIVIIIGGFLIVRSILRAASAPRSFGAAAPPPGAPPGGAGYPGYGYGGMGGGGSFWSGLLGGLGGAWLGNELFRGGGIGPAQAGQVGPDAGGGWGPSDSGGFASDPGQADMGGASGGDWSGGGFGGDFGGGGDAGGGGGDSGGGW